MNDNKKKENGMITFYIVLAIVAFTSLPGFIISLIIFIYVIANKNKKNNSFNNDEVNNMNEEINKNTIIKENEFDISKNNNSMFNDDDFSINQNQVHAHDGLKKGDGPIKYY